MTKKLSVIVICITPFDEARRVDEAKMRKQLGRLRDAGVSVFVGGSGTGEGYSLDPEERDRILAIAVEELKGKVPVYADGVEPHTTKEMVSFVRQVENSGVDAVRVMPIEIGHAAKPSVVELERYNSTVIEASGSPIIITSHQAVGYVLPIDLIERLLNRFPSIIGINYGGTDITYLAELIARVGDRISIHCAGPYNGLSVLGLGGNGFMGGESNFMPSLVGSVISAYQAKDAERVRVSFGKLMALAAVINRYGGFTVRGLKPAMNAFGFPGGMLREPRVALEPAEIDKMVNELLAIKIPGVPAARVN